MWTITALLLFALAEVGSFAFFKYLATSEARFLIWQPDVAQARTAWAEVMGNWDDELGWPSARDAVLPPRDTSGAKLNSDFPSPGPACASAYGDSFVWGSDVGLSDGWVEQLSRKLGCRVAN